MASAKKVTLVVLLAHCVLSIAVLAEISSSGTLGSWIVDMYEFEHDLPVSMPRTLCKSGLVGDKYERHQNEYIIRIKAHATVPYAPVHFTRQRATCFFVYINV